MHMIKLHSRLFSRRPAVLLRLQTAVLRQTLPLHRALYLKDGFDPVGTGQRLSDGYDQIGQLDQLHQNLRHIVDQRHHLSLGNAAFIHPDGSRIEQKDGCCIDNNVCDRIGQCRYPSHIKLQIGKLIIFLLESRYLLFLFVKCADHTGARKILSGCAEHRVQSRLYSAVHGHGDRRDPTDHNGKKRYGHHEEKRRFHIDRKSHDHGTEHDKRRA